MSRGSWVAALAVLPVLITACVEDKPVVSLDQAKQITAQFEGQGFTPPPRTISDITAILDQQKPDPAKAEANRKAADADPPAGIAGAELSRFYFNRGLAANELGRTNQHVNDLRQAAQLGRAAGIDVSRMYQNLLSAERQMGNGMRVLQAVNDWIAATPANAYGEVMNNSVKLAIAQVGLGDFAAAASSLQQAERMFERAQTAAPRSWPSSKEHWRANTLLGRAKLEEARGQFAAAEASYREALSNENIGLSKYEAMIRTSNSPFPRVQIENSIDIARLSLAEVLTAQGRLLEAEAQARFVLLGLIERRGRYAPETAAAVMALAQVVQAEGRYAEAEKLGAAAVDIYENIGAGAGSWALAEVRSLIAETQSQQNRWQDALATFGRLAEVLGDDAPGQEKFLQSNLALATVYLGTHRAAEATPILARVLEHHTRSFGDKNAATAEARGLLAVAMAESGQRDQALAEFRTAMPILLRPSREAAGDEETVASRDQRRQIIVEGYIGALAAARGTPAAAGIDIAAETFPLADAIRGRSVESALAASSARAAAGNPVLADLVRREQDAQKQVASLQGLITTVLASPLDQQDQAALLTLRTQVDQLRTARATIRENIEKNFTDYVNLIDPRPATVEQARAALRPGEALIATYVGQERSFVWAVPQQGPVAFAAVDMDRHAMGEVVTSLRKALDPNAAMLGDIPAFDVALAHKLYTALLQPVEPGWKDAKSLLVVPHGSLGQLPFAVLVTAPTTLAPDRDGQALFAGYKTVPFLAKRASITQLPSVASLGSLRALPAPRGGREAFVGFGDPWFSQSQAAGAARETQVAQVQTRGARTLVQTRGVPLVRRSAPATQSVNSAELSQLPRLADTADEVRAIAIALNADLSRDVFTGREANERRVRTMDLSNRKVVMFATHGLVPGDLNGLTQPALALSAPSVADIDGDGLLTLDEVLALKLNADWVLLSACNTATGDGAGAEAVSGLGRAFFYAGTRALLVSNWPVETTSARILTTDLFRRQAQNSSLTRTEALRQAMVALLDGPGYTDPDSQATVFSYAHPIFWAPFSVVGDGGGGTPGS